MKNTYKNSTEEELVNSLRSIEVTPPNGLWDDINATLVAKRNRKIFIVSSCASAASIALLLSIGGLLLVNSRTETIQTKTLLSKKENSTAISPKESIAKTNSSGTQNIKTRMIVLNSNAQKSEFTSIAKSSSDSTLISNHENEILTVIDPIHPSSIRNFAVKKEEIYPKIKNLEYGLNNAITSVDLAEKKRKGEWIFSATGFPVYSFHTAGVTDQSSPNQEQGIVSWGGSASVQYAFSKRYFFETGVTLNTLGQQEKNLYIVASNASNVEVRNYGGVSNSYGVLSVPNTNLRVMGDKGVSSLSTDAINASSFNKVNALQRFRYLEVPFLIGKGFKLKSLNLKVKAGLVVGFLIDNRLDLTGTNLKLQGKTQGVDPIIASTQASIGISYPVANRCNLIIEPTFRIGLKSLNSTSGKNYPFATYIKFGIEIPF
jgi:hypothetical protein